MDDPRNLILEQLKAIGNQRTMELALALMDAYADHWRRQNDDTSGEVTRIIQGKIQGVKEIQMFLNSWNK